MYSGLEAGVRGAVRGVGRVLDGAALGKGGGVRGGGVRRNLGRRHREEDYGVRFARG